MRNNQPVTGVELPMRETRSLISRTDVKGKITYVNQDFIEVSGFTEQELVGSPHNIVRHPDMPAEAFDDLWKTLKAGHSWSGMVKNRNKSGDHYWVMANATPIWENGAVIGYTSVRTVPSRQQVEQAASLYARFKEGRAGGLYIRNGKVRRRGILGKIAGMKELHIRGRLTLALGVLCAMLVTIGALGLFGLHAANQEVHTVYAKRTVSMGQLDAVIRFLNRENLAMADAINGADPADAKSALAHIAESEKQIDAAWRAYLASPLDASEKKLADQFAADHSAFVARGLAPATTALAAGNLDEAKRLNAEVMKKDFPALRAGIDALLKLQLDAARQEAELVQSNYVFMRNVVMAALALGILFTFMMRMFLVRVIVRPIMESVDVAKQIAAGNLAAHVEVRSDDEMGQMLQTLDTMRKSLSNIIADVRRNAESIGSAAGEIAAGNADLSQRTEEQASTLEETASSMEQLTATVKQNADHSKEARELVNAACSIAAQGGVVMGDVVGTMDTIAQSSKKITDIIGVIDGIAFQTNILALNAAVEAARAGEQGRGFAVVAAEVRSLAQRSAGAAREIKGLISASVDNVQNGAKQVANARDKIDEIVAAVQQVTVIMNDITTASMEQSSGIEQVSQAVMQMDEVTQQNAALVEQAAAAAESLQMQGNALVQGMGVFRLTGDQHVPTARAGAGRRLPAQQQQINGVPNVLHLKSRR